MDSGKPGTKRYVVVDRRGTPLGVRLYRALQRPFMMIYVATSFGMVGE